MKKLIILAILASFAGVSAYGATAPPAVTISTAERADIIKLVEISGFYNRSIQSGIVTVAHSLATLPGVSGTAIKAVQEAVVSVMTRPNTKRKFMNSFVTIYAKHFTDQEIRETIRFYETPLGKKIIKISPVISKEITSANDAIVQSLGGEFINAMKANFKRDHITPPWALPPKTESGNRARD